MLTHTAKHGVTIWREPLAPELLPNLHQLSGEVKQGKGYLQIENGVAYIKVWNAWTLLVDGLPYSARIDLNANPVQIEYRLPMFTLIALSFATLILVFTIFCWPLMIIGLVINHHFETRAIKNFLQAELKVT